MSTTYAMIYPMIPYKKGYYDSDTVYYIIHHSHFVSAVVDERMYISFYNDGKKQEKVIRPENYRNEYYSEICFSDTAKSLLAFIPMLSKGDTVLFPHIRKLGNTREEISFVYKSFLKKAIYLEFNIVHTMNTRNFLKISDPSVTRASLYAYLDNLISSAIEETYEKLVLLNPQCGNDINALNNSTKKNSA